MAEIAQTRSKIAKSVQQQVQNGQTQINMGQPQAQMPGMVPNPGQVQHRFLNNQMPRPGQPPAMGMPNQQPQMQLGNPQARIQMMPQNTPQMMPPQGQFTQQDMQEIARLSQQMAQNTSPEQLNQIRSQLENSPHRQQLLAQGLDPLTHFFRQQAMRRYMDTKRATTQRTGQVGQAQNNVNPEQARPVSQNSAPTQGPPAVAVSASQNIDSSFMGSIDEIVAQQQNARRLQEAGQVVVPASDLQSMTEPQRGAMGTTSQQPNPHAANRPPQMPNAPPQPQAFWNAQTQQLNGQSAGQVQNQAQRNNFQNVATPIPPNLQGQVGGLNATVGQMQQQNSNMPTLTRSVGPQSQTPQPQNMWPQQGTPQMQHAAQSSPLIPQQNNPSGTPQRLRPPPGKNNGAQMQQFLAGLSEDDRRSFIMRLHQQQQQHQQQRTAAIGQPSSGRAQPVAMQAQRSHGGPPSSQAPDLTPGRAANGAHQVNGVQQQQIPVQQPGQSQRPSQQPGDAALAALQKVQAAVASGSLTPDIERQMDNHGFPPGILNANNALSKLPPTVKSWGQLKAWVRENAANLPAGSEAKLRGLQGLHYQSISQKQQNAQQQPAMQPTAPMVPRPDQQPVPAQAQMPNFPQPTIQDVHNARTKYPQQLHSVPDEQVRAMIMKQRRDMWVRTHQQGFNPQQQAQMQLMQQRQQQAQLQQRHQQQQQQQNQSLQNGTQPNQPQQAQIPAQRPQPQQPKQGPQGKEQPHGKAPQAQMQNQATGKGTKRGSSDDVVEVPDPKITQQQQRAQGVKTSQKANVSKARPEQAAQAAQKAPNPRPEAEQRTKRAPLPQASEANQAAGSAQGQQKPEEAHRLEARLKELVDEVSRNVPSRQPIPMDFATRTKMVQKLAQARDHVMRMDRIMLLYFKMFKDENGTKDLIRTVSHRIVQQQSTLSISTNVM